MNEPLPPQWDAAHVERRLVEAMRTAVADRGSVGPDGFRSTWPDYADDYAVDVAAARAFRIGLADEMQVSRAAALGWPEVNRICRDAYEAALTQQERAPVSNKSQMDDVALWPARYLSQPGDEYLLAAVQRVTRAVAAGPDVDWLERNKVQQAWCRAGCVLIAAGLKRDGVAMF